jgi:hypothetical protein
MQCFKHRTAAAVGICKSCGKGVCAACAADTGDGLACSDACEERVLLTSRMVANNVKVMRTANAQNRASGLMAVLIGLVFLPIGVWGYTANHPLLMLFGGLGLIFFVFGFVRLVAERYPTSEK